MLHLITASSISFFAAADKYAGSDFFVQNTCLFKFSFYSAGKIQNETQPFWTAATKAAIMTICKR